MSVVQSSLRLLGLIGRSFDGAAGIDSVLRAGSGGGAAAIALPTPRPAPLPVRPLKPAPGVHERPSPKGPPTTEVQPGSGQDRRRKDIQQSRPAPKPQPASESDAPASLIGDATPATGKHVVILVENLPVPFDRRPWQIAQALTHDGYRVSVICPKMYEYTERYERLNGIDVYRYPALCEGNTAAGWVCEYVNALFWMTWICLKLFVTRGIDAIHACNPPDLLFLVAWPFRVFCGVRFLFDHHDLNPEVYLAKFGRRNWVYRLMCALERMTYCLADVVLATNRSFKRIAIDRDGKNPEQIFVVRNAPMPGRLLATPERDELRFGRRHLVTYLGVMNKQDGLDLLLESIADIVQRHGRCDVVFGLIGDGPELPVLKQRARSLGLNGEVKFLGRISDGRTISDYLNTAAVCVCPDPKNEMNDHSTMTKVVEYMAAGRPIVAYDLTESVYSAADAALYATKNDPKMFADLVVRLLDDEDLRRRMGTRAKERYERMLCWQRSQEQLLAAYTRLFDPRCGLKPA